MFTVTVKNSGCAQEVGLRVTLTIQQSPKPIKSRKTIPLIDSGNEESVSFSGLGLPPLDQKTSLTVEVDPVPGETNTTTTPRTIRSSSAFSRLAGHRLFDRGLLFR